MARREIETDRLQLRWLTLDDAPLMYAVWTDPAFIRFVGDRGISDVDDARSAMAEGPMKIYERFGYGPFHVSMRDSGEPVGVCGLFRREGLEDSDIGFSLLPAFRGMGLAFEAAAATLEYARRDARLRRVTALVSPENEKSISLITRLGMHYERPIVMPGDESPISLYAIQWTESDS